MKGTGAFSLVEVTLAIGVFAYAVIAILGMYPIAMASMGNSRSELFAANLATRIIDDYRGSLAGNFTNSFNMPSAQSVQTNAAGTNFLGREGDLVTATDSEAVYRMVYRIQRLGNGPTNLPPRSPRFRVNLILAWPAAATNPVSSFEVSSLVSSPR